MATQAFWAEDMTQLLAFTSGVLPSTAKNLPVNLNAIARLSLLICLILAFWKPEIAIIPFIMVMVFTMVIYYCNIPVEKYNNDFSRPALLPNDLSQYVSDNQMLVGGPNPKTLIPLMDVTKIRSHDHEAWKNSSLSIRSGINDESMGYASSSSNTTTTTTPLPIHKSGRITILNYGGISETEKFPDITMTDVVDPRFSGHGPTDRCYMDPKDGSRKYFYDDVDSLRMPNYISRNHIDIYPWAPRYGSGYDGSRIYDNTYMSVNHASKNRGYLDLKQDVLDSYASNTARARSELQESLMRKRNGEMWQLRVAPIY